MTQPSIGFLNGVFGAKVEAIGGHRLGMKLADGIFSITGANGIDLSNINLGYVSIPNVSNPTLINTYLINANQSFHDASSGTSNIIGNLFGTTAGDTWSQDVPFFVYVAINDAQTAPIFGISRVPNMVVAPAVGNIGTITSAVADTQYSLFLLSDVVVANYDANPVVCLGSFRMRKDSSDDWTVQAFTAGDGFGRYQENRMFTLPTGVNGAAADTYFLDNGGTAPVPASSDYRYKISRDGMIYINFQLQFGAAGTSGAGAVTLTAVLPLIKSTDTDTLTHPGFGNYQNTPGNPFLPIGPFIQATTCSFIKDDNTADLLENADFPNTDGYSLKFNVNYPYRCA